MSESRLPSIDDFADAEHCVLEDTSGEHLALDNLLEGHRADPSELSTEIQVADKLRKCLTTIRFYAEGWVQVITQRRGDVSRRHRVDLRYLDPTPTRTPYLPVRLLKLAGVLGGCTAIAAVAAVIGWFALFTIPAAVLGGIGTLGTLVLACYRCHEKIVFRTLHGRAEAIRLVAGLGTIRRMRSILPQIVQAIAVAAESIHDQTAVYLRAEMREHYRLRNEGVLSVEECAESTGRILGEFDTPR